MYRHYDYGKLTPEQAAIVEDCHSLIFKALHYFRYDPDEYYDVAAISLCKAVQSYPVSGVSCSFRTYAFTRIHRDLGNSVRDSKRHNVPTVSLDASIPWLDGMTLMDTVPDRGGLRLLHSKRAHPCCEHERAHAKMISPLL